MILLLLGAGGSYGAWSYMQGARAVFNGPTWVVAKERLKLVIVERGTLESAENSDIVCRVKAGKKGTSGIIKWVVDDGTQVEKGQKLIEIDDSALQEELTDQINKVNNAKAAWISAKENLQITESSNFSDIESAKTVQILAELELKKFLGDRIAVSVLPINTRADLQRYLASRLELELARQAAEANGKSISDVVQTLSDIEGRIELARGDLKLAKDRADWSVRMVSRGYISRSQADADKSKFDGAKLAMEKTQLEYDLFRRYTIEQKVTELWSKVKEADRALDRVRTQADSKKNTAQADLESKKSVFGQETDRKQDIENEIAKCVLYAPQPGLVVYYQSEQSKWGGSTQQGMVAQGEAVKEGQKLMRIPNLARMMVDTRVHEAMVSKVKGEVTRPTHFTNTVRAAFCMDRFPMSLALSQVAFDDMYSDFRDKDFDVLYPGQRAFVRVDAQSSKVYQGRVKSVATVASQADWSSADVKVYKTMVSIDETVTNLKPGMSAEVTILAEESTEPVMTIPIQSVVGSIAMGAKRKCYILENDRPREIEVTVGRSNDKMVEVKEGLNEGDKVVLNPRSLLGDKSGMKVGAPSTRRGVDSDDEGGGGKKSSKKKGGAAPGGLPPGGPGGPPGGAIIPGGGKQYNRPEANPANGKKS